MNPRIVSAVACVIAVAALLAVPRASFAADKADAGKSTKSKSTIASADGKPKVYLFKGEKRVKSAGGEMLTLLVSDAFTGKSETLYVPGNDPASKEYDPKTEIRELVEAGLEPGTPLDVTTEKQKGRLMATSVKKTDIKPGEEAPNGFVFVESREDEKTKAVAVTLSKFGRELVVGVPMIKQDEYEDAEWQPDPKIDYVVRRLQAGMVVDAVMKKQSNRVMIAEIYEYRKPERGKFAGLKEVEFNNWPAAGFEIAAEDGTTITFTIDGIEQTRNGKTMFVPNPQQLGMVKRIKKGTDVEVRYRLDGRTWMMRDIKPIAAAKVDRKSEKSSGAAEKAKDDEMKKDDDTKKGDDDMEKPKADKG